MPPTTTQSLYYLGDLRLLRDKLARAERDDTRLGRVWAGVRRRARTAPDAFPWFVPFVATVTGEESDLEAARRQIRNYVATFEAQQFGMGLQFHFWCFSFPHARWALYFHWLDALGAWAPKERVKLREAIIAWQFANFFYGMRTKPEPECVDNQTMSLCFSNALFGQLFGSGPEASPTAQRMARDGLRRLPGMLGGFPPSGYSGEGSTYMDFVVGPCVPFLVELLERAHGGDWFSRDLPPNGGSAAAIVRMISREWMPNGLLLPWDHYGYTPPVRSCIAYGAYRTNEPLYFDLLEKAANWGFDGSIGWGYDDLIWTLVWWPGKRPPATGKLFSSWAEPELGGALVSDDGSLYLMQMWDRGTPKAPIREHVNPNSLVLCAGDSPMTVDGVPSKACTAFNFADTCMERTGQNFAPVKFNFGVGCAGGHSVLLVDDWEGMRPDSDYRQADLVTFDAEARVLTGDVTPLYRERWPDTRRVRRRSRLCANTFWLIEDLAAFGTEHRVTARWYLRPEQVPAAAGVAIETAEGMRLNLLPIVGPDVKQTQRIPGYPDRLDGESWRVDFQQTGSVCRWLWLAFPEATRATHADVTGDWAVAGDPQANWDLALARAALKTAAARLPLSLPAFMLADLPIQRRWWYQRTIQAPATSRWWLRLPRGLIAPRLWVNGSELDLSAHRQRLPLLPAHIAMPAGLSGHVDIVLCTDVGVCQYGKDSDAGSSFSGSAAVLVPAASLGAIAADYRDGVVHVRRGTDTWDIPHTLMPEEG